MDRLGVTNIKYEVPFNTNLNLIHLILGKDKLREKLVFINFWNFGPDTFQTFTF